MHTQSYTQNEAPGKGSGSEHSSDQSRESSPADVLGESQPGESDIISKVLTETAASRRRGENVTGVKKVTRGCIEIVSRLTCRVFFF